MKIPSSPDSTRNSLKPRRYAFRYLWQPELRPTIPMSSIFHLVDRPRIICAALSVKSKAILSTVVAQWCFPPEIPLWNLPASLANKSISRCASTSGKCESLILITMLTFSPLCSVQSKRFKKWIPPFFLAHIEE